MGHDLFLILQRENGCLHPVIGTAGQGKQYIPRNAVWDYVCSNGFSPRLLMIHMNGDAPQRLLLHYSVGTLVVMYHSSSLRGRVCITLQPATGPSQTALALLPNRDDLGQGHYCTVQWVVQVCSSTLLSSIFLG